MSDNSSNARTVAVVGAGPVGCLAAMALAKRGWRVDLYEGRADLRLPESRENAALRSINLAMSHRGIIALQAVNPAAADRFLADAIPMHGRMIHTPKGEERTVFYDRDNQHINSIDRAVLNQGLLDEVEALPGVKLHFRHKVQNIDFDGKRMTVRDLETGQDREVQFDFCIGADGSYSVVRRQMMRVVRMDFEQKYMKDEYMELRMPPGRDADGQTMFLLHPNRLHIWPRHSFMLIALPNKDKTFTCTLFAPSTEFDKLDTVDKFLSWFEHQFPDAYRLIGADLLAKDYGRNPRCPLICTTSNPYHYKDRAIILGDAAHAMVPFYGQGLNCGLEDVRVLGTILEANGITSEKISEDPSVVDPRLASALAHYSETRHEDLVAICDLAQRNYIEMRHSVTTPMFLFKKAVDNVLYALSRRQRPSLAAFRTTLASVPFPAGYPSEWIPLYTMVTFRPDVSYAVAQRKAERQARILTALGWLTASVVGTGSVLAAIAGYQRAQRLLR
ncbi:FAD/NAD(P)-binding domain-containing protein [Schizophyllum commune H4-8]|uniref:Kynurenine 3-monooxygenase n=1 Tax=Schizophyllum commune (strain H4-8 / FGSC 9210) TaxID=578458 RepID=D8PWY3_SCHCM|nr:FAD/NAD(P)-binding domain-containing protein [Schizophyllum commune H4-8]KAI5899766.1 FAD/NAD(P)-binding domain-containing protein [Schizophyllum commune H4-8]